MRTALTVVFTVALVTSLIVVNRWLAPFASRAASKEPAVEVMVAAHDLPAGLVVQECDLRIVQVSSKLITPDIPRKRSQVLGHKTVREIGKGDSIRLSDVDPEATKPMRLGPPL